MLKSIVRTVGAAVRVWHVECKRLIDTVKSFVPATVVTVRHIDSGNRQLADIYSCTYSLFNWARGGLSTVRVPYSGFYLVTACNAEKNRFLSTYVLSAQQLNNAMQLRGLSSLWALSDFGFCKLLSSFYSKQNIDKHRIFAILIDGEDVTKDLLPYLDSIVMDDNLTARSLCLLYESICGFEDDALDSVVLVDHDLEERTVNGDELLFPHYQMLYNQRNQRNQRCL